VVSVKVVVANMKSLELLDKKQTEMRIIIYSAMIAIEYFISIAGAILAETIKALKVNQSYMNLHTKNC